MDKTTRIYQRAAELVGLWGKAPLINGKTLEEMLTIDGVSLWSVIAPSLALSHVSAALTRTNDSDILTSTAFYARRYKKIIFETALPFLGNSRGCGRWPEAPAFLLLGFSRYISQEILDPVAQTISGRKSFSVVLTDSLTARISRPGLNNISAHSVWRHWDRRTAAKAQVLKNDLERVITEIKESGALPSIIKDGEDDLFPVLSNTFSWLFETLFPRMLNYVAVARHILTQHKSKLIVSPDVSDPRIRIYMLLARELGIPSLEIQFGVTLDSCVEWRFFLADQLAVSGEATRNVMITHGIPPERVTVTGSPRYDAVSNASPWERRKKRKSLGIDENSLMLVFASQPYIYGAFYSAEMRIASIRDLFTIVGSARGIQLVVKPHPLEDRRELRQLAGSQSNITFVDQGEDIRQLIRIGDVFATFSSNTAFDALAMDKPTIILPSARSFFSESGAALVARSKEDILAQLKAIAKGLPPELAATLQSARRNFLGRWLYKTDGYSAERIVDLAFQLADTSKTALL